MGYNIETLIHLVTSGASVVVGSDFAPEGLLRVAEAMPGKPCHLTIKGIVLSPSAMLRISEAAPGQVTFDTSGA